MAIIFSADNHIKQRTFSGCATENGGPIEGVRQVFETARKYEALLSEPVSIVLGGDVFDEKRIQPCFLQEVSSLLNTYRIPVYYICGNHDSTEPAWLSLLPYTQKLTPEVKTVLPGGETVVGFDYCTPGKIKGFLDLSEKGNDFLVVHQFISGTLSQAISASIPVEMFRDFPVVLAGDIHQELVISNRLTEVYYPGPSNRCSVTEPEGGCLVITRQPLAGSQRMLNNFFCLRERFSIRSLHTDEFLEPLTVEKVQELTYSHSEERSPFLLLKAPAFDSEAVRLLREKFETPGPDQKDKFHLLLRRSAGGDTELTCSESSDPILASNVLEYAVRTWEELNGLPSEVKELGKSVLLNEDAFFTEMTELLIPAEA